VKWLDLKSEPSIEPLLAMLRQMTRSTSSRDVLGEFMGQYSKVRPIDAFVGLVPVNDEQGPGAYKVTYAVRASDAVDGRVPHSRDMRPEALAKLAPRRGGVLAKLIQGNAPQMVYELPEIEDEFAGPVVAGLRACMVIPIYDGDEICEWTFAFSNVPEGHIQPKDVGHAALTANLLGAANRHIDLLNKIKALNSALAQQIEGIVRVQQSLLPNALPRIPGFDIATSYLTSDAAGGDYFDFFPLPNGEMGILIADVSGHGPAAATVMAMLHAILHAYPTDPDLDPAAIMSFANNRLYDAGIDGSFVTAFFAILAPSTQTLRFCNCGHNPPRLRQLPLPERLTSLRHLAIPLVDSAVIAPIDQGTTIPLGILPILPNAATQSVHLRPGDTLVLYTDGITEAFNAKNEMFGEEGLDDAIKRAVLIGRASPADAIIEEIHQGMFTHRGLRPLDDDQTIVIIHYLLR